MTLVPSSLHKCLLELSDPGPWADLHAATGAVPAQRGPGKRLSPWALLLKAGVGISEQGL